MPEVTIIINCHNGDKYLSECIDSVFGQTFNDWEIVFWDNKSSDKSASIAKKYGPKLRYFYGEKKLSLGHARQLAMQEARGEYIAFLDTDDLWLEAHLEEQVAFMENNEFLASYAGIQEINADGVVIRDLFPHFSSGPMLCNILRQFEINVPTMMLHRSLIFEYGFFFNPSIFIVEEFELFVRIAVYHEIGVIHKVLAQYRVHEGGLMSRTPLLAAQERNVILTSLIKNNPVTYAENQQDFLAAFARSAYYEARSHAENGNLPDARRVFKKYRFNNYIYFCIYISFWLPKTFWMNFNLDNLKRNPVLSWLVLRVFKK